MSEVDDVMEATIAAITAAVPSLNGYAHITSNIELPAVMAFPPSRISYGETMSDDATSGDATMLYVVRLYAYRTQDGADEALLNAFISRTGSTSIIAALKVDPTLGGIVADVRPLEATDYGNWPIGGEDFLGVEVRLQALLL